MKKLIFIFIFVLKALCPTGKDGPASALINNIQELGGVAPVDWKGYREVASL